MRPHSFVIIAVILHYLQHPSSSKNYFTIKMSILKGHNVESERTYRVTVDEKSENKWKMRVTREEGQIRYYCTLEVKRPDILKDKFIIEHDHTSWITEEFSVFSGSLDGQYNSHRTYTRFRGSQTPEPHNLYLYSDYNDYRYRVDNFS